MLLNKELTKLGYVFKYKNIFGRLEENEERTSAVFMKPAPDYPDNTILYKWLYINIIANNTTNTEICHISVRNVLLYGEAPFVRCYMYYNKKM